MSRLRMNWITAPPDPPLSDLGLLSLCFLPGDAMRGLRTIPGSTAAQGVRRPYV